LLYGSIATVLLWVGHFTTDVFIVVLFWDNKPPAGVGYLYRVVLCRGLLAWNALRRVAEIKSKLFSASLAELADDYDLLAPRS